MADCADVAAVGLLKVHVDHIHAGVSREGVAEFAVHVLEVGARAELRHGRCEAACIRSRNVVGSADALISVDLSLEEAKLFVNVPHGEDEASKRPSVEVNVEVFKRLAVHGGRKNALSVTLFDLLESKDTVEQVLELNG